MQKKAINTLFILITATIAVAYSPDDTIFPIPAILKDNVAFWKKIYSEISLKEGVIHDRDYPGIIYDRLNGDSRSPKVKARKESIAASLRAISSSPESSWTTQETEIYKIYIAANGDKSVLKEAADRIRFQQGQMERFQEGLERSGLYIDTIRAILKSYGVPSRLAYLPHVESSFNTEAYSKVGAAGLWQFMRGTGKMYRMQIDYLIDERRDPIIATIAAAKYLSSSYAELKTWPLAITSYNHGVYGMKRAVAQTGSNDIAVIIQNYSSRSFRFASSNFYGCFLAASEIADNYKTYFPNVSLMAPIRYTSIVISNYVKPDIIESIFGITRKQFSDLNPAIRPAVFDQNKYLPKGFTIHLPGEINTTVAINKLKAIPDSLKRSEPEHLKYYSVRSGDNLYTIARRLGVTVKSIALENNITKLNRIHIGQVLRIPETGTEPTAVASSTPKPESEKATPAIVTSAPNVDSSKIEAAIEIAQAELDQITPPEEEPVEQTPSTKKTTQEKEVLVSPKTKTPPKKEEQIAETELLSDSLKAIALAPALAEPVATPNKKPVRFMNFDISLYNLDVTLSSGGSSALIEVSINETIGHYADWLGIPTWKIRKLNDMGRASTIKVNQKLRIPIDNGDVLENFSSTRLEYHMAIEEDFYSQYVISDAKAHIVKRGQTLWDLCNDGETTIPLWVLHKYNKQIDLNKIIPGMTVWIPYITELTQEEIEHRKNAPAPIDQPYRQPMHDTPSPTKRIP